MKNIILKFIYKLGYRIDKISSDNLRAYSDEVLYRELYPEESLRNRLFYNIGAGAFFHPYWTNIDNKSDWYENYQQYFVETGINFDLFSLGKLPLNSDSAECFYSSHTLEHISDDAALNILKESYRILKNGGFIRLTMPDIDLAYSALLRNDINWWYWREDYSLVENYKRIKHRGPMNDFSIYQLFVDHIGSTASMLPDDLAGANIRITDDEVKYYIADKHPEELFDFIVSKCDLIKQEQNPGYHINWWNRRKLEDFLSRAGFTNIKFNGFGQSENPIFRNVELFDNTHPKQSIYVEAVK
jgi:predicted SAM-dependent methyltransferase